MSDVALTPGPLRHGLRLLVVLALLAVALAVPGVSAEAVTRPRTLYDERPVSTGVVEPWFPIDHVGVVFDLPPGADVDHEHGDGRSHLGVDGLAVRMRTDGRWGPWEPVIEDGAQAAGQWTGALVSADDADAYQVRGVPASARKVRAAAINTTDGPREVVGRRPAGSAEAVTSCRSRGDWGADESIRTFTRSYAPVQLMTVHHTATQNDDPDPDARVRAIYEYHVKTNGWDDIGYQALISEDGTVYEGRWSGTDSPSCLTAGGTGWGFGHAGTTPDADMVTGAHTGGYNTGNFGVALLGTLTDVAPKADARAALVEYLAELSDRHGVDAQSMVAYDNGTNARTADAVSGHRDFTATECPGGTLYADLPDIRAEVAAAVTGDDAGDTPPPDYVDDVSSGELAVTGSVSGTYADTQADGGPVQTIGEAESRGRPQDRHSLLEHVWTVPVTGGASVTLFVDATASDAGDGDDFAFAYSLDGGSTYAHAVTVPAGASGTYSAALPPTTQGPVHVRVRDTNRAEGTHAVDTIAVDHLFVRSETSGSTSTDPADPAPSVSDIALSATSYKVKGQHHVDLAWSGATNVRLYRDGSAITDVAGSTHTDVPGGNGNGQYTYRVCALDSAGTVGTCSDPVTATFS